MDIQRNESVASPEELLQVGKNNFSAEINIYLAEVWKIGMLSLVMGTLSKDQIFYDWKNFEIKMVILGTKLEEFRERYKSPQLVKLVSSCLTYSQNDRPSLKELSKMLELRKKEEN